MSNRIPVVTALLLLLLTISFGQNSEFVSTHGAEIVGPDGKAILLQGINIGNWLVPEGYMFKFDSATSPRKIHEVLSELVGAEAAQSFWRTYRDKYITRDDIRFIKRTGMNSIRVPFNWRLFTTDDYANVWAGPGFEMLDRLMAWCSEEGLWVVLDMHCAPGGQTGDNIDDSWGYPFLFESPESQQRTIELWKRIAERYRNERVLVGYDLLNEPIAHYYDRQKLNPLLEPLYKRIVSAIREVDPDHLVFLGGAQWNTNFGAFGAPFDPKLVYTFHKYWCDTTQAMVQEYVDFRANDRVPLWMGESGENSDQWIGSFRRLQEKNNIGWCFWPYKKMDASSCLVTFSRPQNWDLIVKYANGPRTSFATIRSRRPAADLVLKALEEFAELSSFKNCRVNVGYLNALGKELPR